MNSSLTTKVLNQYWLYQRKDFKKPPTLLELKSFLIDCEENRNCIPNLIGMKKEDIIRMGKIEFGGVTDYLHGIKFRGKEIRVIPVKTCLLNHFQLYY